ncbi:MAG: hypothetical protein HOP34_12970 [Methylococcaceae bacterium]|nr:hypothetical protein [Methylococcaceae bacterium]
MFKEANILLSYLPEIYQTSGQDLQKLLTAFEHILLGGEGNASSLQEMIAAIPQLFDPNPDSPSPAYLGTPKQFLPWLAQWVALSQSQFLSEAQCRFLIANIIPLYASRGTKKYLTEILSLFFPDIQAVIYDKELPALMVGQSTVGINTRLGGDIPFYFSVTLHFPEQQNEYEQIDKLKEQVHAVIDLAKPAHTMFHMECLFGGSEKLTS